ncbi:MAG: ABC transporter ATP-binding protein [Verrucomicrobia bacterium]|nr:MAG: ABC transporter ATP-binding protein [Verrucomicrobiota bacterium]
MDFRRFLPYTKYFRGTRLALFWALVCAGVYGIASGFGLPFMIQYVFPKVFDFNAPPLDPWVLAGYVLWLPGVFLVRGLAGYLNIYLINLCGVRVLKKIRTEFFAKLQALPVAFFDRHSTGDLLSRATNDTNQLQQTVTLVSNEIFRQPITLLGAIGALIYLSTKHNDVVFLLLFFAIVPITVFPIRIIGGKLLKKARLLQGELGSVTDRMSENLNSRLEIRAFGLEQREIESFRRLMDQLIHAQMKVVKYAEALSPLIEILSAAGVAIAFLYAHLVQIPLETFVALVGALYMSYDPVKRIGRLSNELKKGEGALERIEAILKEPVTITDPENPVPVQRLRGEIHFDNVSFAYGDEPVLRGITTHIPAGTVCALVGPSGAGKSTFARLVPRFYDVVSGAVKIDGIDVRAMRLADLRANIAIVSQEPILFNDTVRNNILVGRPDATAEEVEAAARNAYADDFIRKLPQGYETIVGERGASLSGGQRQRLALARAFLRNAPILILDEATSALDAESEEMVQKALARLVEGKTVLIIAHRFSTIRIASRILVFDAGRIVGEGDHDTLHAGNDVYRRLYDKQR